MTVTPPEPILPPQLPAPLDPATRDKWGPPVVKGLADAFGHLEALRAYAVALAGRPVTVLPTAASVDVRSDEPLRLGWTSPALSAPDQVVIALAISVRLPASGPVRVTSRNGKQLTGEGTLGARAASVLVSPLTADLDPALPQTVSVTQAPAAGVWAGQGLRVRYIYEGQAVPTAPAAAPVPTGLTVKAYPAGTGVRYELAYTPATHATLPTSTVLWHRRAGDTSAEGWQPLVVTAASSFSWTAATAETPGAYEFAPQSVVEDAYLPVTSALGAAVSTGVFEAPPATVQTFAYAPWEPTDIGTTSASPWRTIKGSAVTTDPAVSGGILLLSSGATGSNSANDKVFQVWEEDADPHLAMVWEEEWDWPAGTATGQIVFNMALAPLPSTTASSTTHVANVLVNRTQYRLGYKAGGSFVTVVPFTTYGSAQDGALQRARIELSPVNPADGTHTLSLATAWNGDAGELVNRATITIPAAAGGGSAFAGTVARATFELHGSAGTTSVVSQQYRGRARRITVTEGV